MAEFENTVITEKGLALLQSAQYGDFPLKFVKVAAGDGEYTESGEELKTALRGLTELRRKKQEVSDLTIDTVDQYTVRVRAVISNKDLTEGFHVREIGLYAEDPEHGDAPVLYAATALTDPEKDDYWPKYNDQFPVTHSIVLYVAVSDSTSVTVLDNPDAYITRQEYDDFKSQTNGTIGGLTRPGDYSSANTYEVGDTVTHDGKVYRCKSKISTTEEWTEAHWEKVDLYAETGKLQAESREHYASIEILKKETADQNLIDNRNYPGRDLKVVFADEIEEAGDEWEWIQKRTDKGDFSGLRNEDWISFNFDGQTYDAQPAGMDTYYETGYAEQHGVYDTTGYVPIPHHIDFITKQCMPTGIKWNETQTNSGTAEIGDEGTDVPWLTCNLKKQLDALFEKLPENLKKHITEKVMLLERRASKPGAPLTASTGWHWYPMGKLWVPTEYEVFGSVVWGTPGWSAGQAMQYPLFAHNWKHTLKHKAGTSERCYWWLASVSGHYATAACAVDAAGHANNYLTTCELCAPLCFRITANPS